MSNLRQFVPLDADRDGRSSAAKAIKSALAKGGRSEIARYFSEADIQRMLKTHRDREEERQATRQAERALRGGVGNRLSLSDPGGDVLRKGGGVPHTALDIIKAIHSAGLNRLAKVHAGSPTAVNDFPPQNSNGRWDGVRADDGAGLSHDVQDGEYERGAERPKPDSATPPHSASIRSSRLPTTQDDGTAKNGGDLTVQAIKLLHRIGGRPLVPGALGGQAQDPNRDDPRR